MNCLRAYAQLVRLPNVFTAFADIGLGILATWQLLPEDLPKDWVWRALCLLAASGCLYCGGMVFNDVFDLEQDKRERPFRPIPSGRISRLVATLFGAALLAAGIGCVCEFILRRHLYIMFSDRPLDRVGAQIKFSEALPDDIGIIRRYPVFSDLGRRS